MRACALRLTNVYGPRQLLRHNRQGFIGWFIRLVLEDQEIQVFGDGSQIRDFVYVDDAVEAFLAAGATDSVNGEAFNVGGEEHISHRDLVKMLVEIAGSGRYTFVEWPADKKVIDIGSFYADSSLFRGRTGWAPSVSLREGFARTFDYYRKHLPRYVERQFRLTRSSRPKTPPTSRRRSIACSRAAGSCSAPKSKRSNPSSPRRAGCRTPSASAPAPTRSR